MTDRFDVKLTADDMFRFHMYHTYTSVQGILSLVVGTLLLALVLFSDRFSSAATAVPYGLLAVVMIVSIPISLRLRAKQQVKASDVLSRTLQFQLREDGIFVQVQGLEEEALLPWDGIYKAVTTKHNLLIYSNRVTAYIIPKDQVKEQLPDIYQALREHCEDYRLQIKN